LSRTISVLCENPRIDLDRAWSWVQAFDTKGLGVSCINVLCHLKSKCWGIYLSFCGMSCGAVWIIKRAGRDGTAVSRISIWKVSGWTCVYRI
jgi:hypothetical protein